MVRLIWIESGFCVIRYDFFPVGSSRRIGGEISSDEHNLCKSWISDSGMDYRVMTCSIAV
jgi:hypothetical protein